MTARAATYVYCLLRAARQPRLRVAPAGLPGASRPRALPAGGGLWLLVADAPLARYGEAAIERGLADLDWVSRCAVAHEAVVEHAGRSGAVVPMKLFTLFASDERAMAWERKEERRLARVLDRVEGREEWGVRIALDRPRALRAAEALAKREAGPAAASGAGFLARKRRVREVVRGIGSLAAADVASHFRRLARLSDESQRKAPVRGGDVVMDGAFLVSSSKSRAFRAEVKTLSRELVEQGYGVVLTGPWPPYHFVQEAAA